MMAAYNPTFTPEEKPRMYVYKRVDWTQGDERKFKFLRTP
jgi:hypothetical protein